MDKLKPCPFCGCKLTHINGKRVNRYYNGELTTYQHIGRTKNQCNCILEWKMIRRGDIEAWNGRVANE